MKNEHTEFSSCVHKFNINIPNDLLSNVKAKHTMQYAVSLLNVISVQVTQRSKNLNIATNALTCTITCLHLNFEDINILINLLIFIKYLLSIILRISNISILKIINSTKTQSYLKDITSTHREVKL